MPGGQSDTARDFFMIWIIARKELLENLNSHRFYILTGLLCVIIVVSVFVSCGDYELRVEHYTLNKPEPNSSAVMIPPDPLSIFAKGTEANIGRLYWVHSTGIEMEASQQSINRLFSLFTVPDVHFIIKVLLSLIALLFSFDMITGERESGTLKLALANGASKPGLLFGKLAGRFLLVIVPFFILFMIAGAVVSSLSNVESGSFYWERVISLMVVSALYVAVFCALGLLLSSLVTRSSTSLILSLAVWVLFIFVIPQVGTALATSLTPVPPSERLEMQERLIQVRAKYERLQREKISGRGKELTRYYQEVHDANRQLLDSYRPELNNLINVTKNIVRLSPSGALTFLVTDIANTGVYEELRLKSALSLHLDRNFDILSDIEKGTAETFHYERSPFGEVLSQTAYIDIVVLVVFLFGLTAGAMARFARYDPR